MRKRSAWLLLLIGICVGGKISSTPIPALDLEALTSQSDVIAVGEIQEADTVTTRNVEVRGNTMAAQIVEARMRPDRVLKGSGNQFLTFRFELPQFGMGYRGVAAGLYRIVFLKRSENGLELTSPYYPSFPAAPEHSNTSNQPFDGVVAEIAGVLELHGASEAARTEAVWALRTVTGTRSALHALELAAASDPSIKVKLSSAAALLAHGDMSPLASAESALANPSIPDDLRQNLASAIYEGVRDEAAIPTLTRLMAIQDVRVRRAATMALRNTGSANAAGALLTALQDTDEEVRYYAVIGLAEITRQTDWRPLRSTFHENGKLYVDHWKNWAESGGPGKF